MSQEIVFDEELIVKQGCFICHYWVQLVGETTVLLRDAQGRSGGKITRDRFLGLRKKSDALTEGLRRTAPEGAAGRTVSEWLTEEESDDLLAGQRVEIIWSGGHGPHVYRTGRDEGGNLYVESPGPTKSTKFPAQL
ncbi:hypothetical protein [Limnoglobus roseus]|uniref:Uncharacterized protein n=1 Tax=Limnoglobus roseus TaxID=2598579 RepID=A0A5C1AR61_9BACT|nr:hypothetical protein [Limnoglobus roseus]QEL20543.1 hypothetical protein PX52LOC_07648 [Limnoglobus roseus]